MWERGDEARRVRVDNSRSCAVGKRGVRRGVLWDGES